MSEETKKSGLDPLMYAALRALDEFKVALEEYEENKTTIEYKQTEIWSSITENIAQLISKYNLSLDSLVETLPTEYKMFYRVVKRMRVDQAVDIASDIVKEYTKDENGNYRSVEETLARVMSKRILKRIFT